MSVTRPVNLSKEIAVRLDPKLKTQLSEIAIKKEYKVSQLIRWSISEYLASDSSLNKSEHPAGEPLGERMVAPDLETPVLSFRLPEALFEALEEHAKAHGETVSEIVRQAITRWIANVDLQKLGILGGSK